jgi:hypothetical protein
MNWKNLFAALATVLAIGYWVFDDLVIDREPLRVSIIGVWPDPVAPGKTATLLYAGRQNYRCAGIVHRWIVDSSGVVHDLVDVPMFTYDSTGPAIVNFAREIEIPPSAAAGEATINVRAERYCNIIQEWFSPTIDQHTFKFTIRNQ